MPSMMLDKVEVRETKSGKKTYAKDLIPKGTNIGPIFMIRGKTGDYKRDFIRTELGKYITQNQFYYNLKIQARQYKIYAIATENIYPGDELVIDQFPWMLPFYTNFNK